MRLTAGPSRADPSGYRAPPDPATGLVRVISADGRTDPTLDPCLPAETLLALYREMLRARLVDSAMIALQHQGRIAAYNAARGQEAVAVGATFALEPTDFVFPALRENAVLLARGLPLSAFLSQLFGSAADPQKGRQTPGYMSARSLAVVSTSSAVATQLPHAVGMAWAARRDGARTAVLAFVGEGGTSSGDFHAALNFAAVFRAPCIVIVQNNQFALSTPASRQTASVTFAAKGRAYGVPSLRIDGSDVLAVYRGVEGARVRAVSGAGPTLLECVTTSPRATTPEGTEGTADEDARDERAGDADPLARLARHLEHRGLFGDEAAARLEAEITGEIARAVDLCEGVPAPRRDTLFDDIYATRLPHLEEQAKSFARR
jgi:pyruvate dehydrogenase E1 component alpha subunit/2-oxoisovalerate dehydrogenase E1 component alpha subunit